MSQRYRTFLQSLLGFLFALSILGCAPMTLDALQASRPSASKFVVCRAPPKAPPQTKFFAYQRSTGRIWWDADRASFERFVEMYADAIYEVHPYASEQSVRQLPPPHDRLTCGGEQTTEFPIGEQDRQALVEILSNDCANGESAAVDRRNRSFVGDFIVPIAGGRARPPFTREQIEAVGRKLAEAIREQLPMIDHPIAQGFGGFTAGLASGTVPLGSVGTDVAIEAGVIPKGTRPARIGKALGEMTAGGVQFVIGGKGMLGGGGLSLTGGGAVVGVPLFLGSFSLAVNGEMAFCNGSRQLVVELFRSEDPPASTSTPSLSTPPTPAAAPAPAPKPVAAPAPTPKPVATPAPKPKPVAKPQQTPSPTPSARLGSGKVKVGPTGNVTRTWVPCTGQVHHAISRKIHKELEKHATLKGIYKYRDPRFVTQAINKQAHIGYQTWHKKMEDQVEYWLKQKKSATPAEFEEFLRDLYVTDSDLISRFPNGL